LIRIKSNYYLKVLSLFAGVFFSGVSYAGDYTLYFVRHFEKQAGGPDPELTIRGHQRAQQLADLLDNVGLQKIYSSDYHRTKQSAKPIADHLNVDITLYNPRELAALAAELIKQGETALIVGHSNTTPNMVNLVGGKAEPLTEKDYGDVFIVKFSDKKSEAKSHLKVTLND
jgi:broad specificity phosphatase PhoE